MMAATSSLSLAASSVVFLVASTEFHLADRAASHFERYPRRMYFRGALVGGALLAAVAAITYLLVLQWPSALSEQIGAIVLFLVGFRCALMVAAAKAGVGGANSLRMLVALDDPGEPVFAEKRGAQLILIQGHKIAAAWLGAALISNPASAAVAAFAGLWVAAALHARITHTLSPSIFYAGCAVSAISLSLHVISKGAQAAGVLG